MKKITLMIFMFCISVTGFAQLAEEGFEDPWTPSGPVNWLVHQNTVGTTQKWKQTSTANPTVEAVCDGLHSAFLNQQNGPNGGETPKDWLVTPAFNLPENPELRFTSRLAFNGDQGGIYKVLIIPATGTPAETDTSILTNYVDVVVWDELTLNPTQQTCTLKKVTSFPAELIGTQVRLAFYMEGDEADRWIIDLVSVVEQCLVPTDLNAQNVGLDSADLSWDPGNGTTWEIEIIPAVDTPTGEGDVIDDPSITPDLNPDTDYKFYVRAICGGSNTSEWSLPYNFSTVGLGDNCNAPLVIPDLPYSTIDNTNNYGDEYSGIPGSNCGTSEWDEFLNGNDVVYSYTAEADGIINISMTETDMSAGLFVYESCEDIGVNCIGGGTFNWEEIPVNFDLNVVDGQTYFIVISTWAAPQFTPYHLVIQEVFCDPPVGLPSTNIGETSVDLSWTNPTDADSWQIVVQQPDGGIPTGAGLTVANNTEYTVTETFAGVDLVSATPYEYYVRADCGDGNFSQWAGPYDFNTMICDVADQCTYTFVMTSMWGGWNDAFMTVSQNGITLATIGEDFTWEDGVGPIEVEVQVCNGFPVELFFTEGGWSPDGVGIAIRNGFDQTVYESGFGGATVGATVFEETVNCDAPSCVPPTNLVVTNQNPTSVDLGWDGAAGLEYEYFYVEAGGPAPTEDTEGTVTTNNPVTIPDLDPATNYDFYVRYVCSDTENSEWDGPLASNTDVCEEATKCVYTFEMRSVNGWGYGGNTMSIFQAGVPVATIGEEFENGQSMEVEIPLCPGEEIEIVWNNEGWDAQDKELIVYSPFAEDIYYKPAGMGEQGTTLFTGVISCDAPPCPKPQNLSVSDIQLTSAMLEWEEMGDAAEWEVWVLPYGSPAPTTPGTVTDANPFSTTEIQELNSGTAYVFYVRANCGDVDGYSTWSGPFVFVTAIANDDCDGALPVPVNPGIDCIEIANGTLSGATSSGVMASCNWQAPTWDVWFSFVAEEATHSISLSNMVGGNFSMSVYEGTDCGALTDIYCNWETNTTVSGLTPGETYYVQVFTDWLNNPNAPTSFELCVLTPASIVTDNTTYTVEELVQQILVTSSCAQVSNISWTTGTSNDWGGENGIAMFDKGMSGFPMQQGVVLATGNAMSAPGPNTNTLSEGFWPGDDDLFNYIQDSGIDPDLWSYNDATVLEFDFVPLTDHMSFPFIFASEEYGTFQCSFSDAFAFFLTDITTGTPGPTQNLAVIPGTDIPVSVVTIRDEAYNSGCDSQNVEFFDTFYELGDMSAAINYFGNTIPMVAEADVIIGNTYHIKLVIADRNDNSMDSAVFIGPFDIGDIDLGVDLTEENGDALCEGEEIVLNSNLDPDDYAFEWSVTDENGNTTILEGETGPTLEVTGPGTYTLEAQYLASTCAGSDSVVIEYYDPIEEITGDPVDLNACDDSGFFEFDLSDNTDLITGGSADYEISYHETEADAEANVNALDLAYTNEIQFLQTIYVRIHNTVTGCTGVKEFNLIVGNTPPQFELTQDITLCEGTSGTLMVTAIGFDPNDASYAWTWNGAPFGGDEDNITVTEEGIYEVTVSLGCTGTMSTNVDVVPEVVADVLANVTVCGEFILPALSDNNSYFDAAGGTGNQLAVGTPITSNQTVYIYAQVGECTDESSFTVTVVPAPLVEVKGDCVNNEYVLTVTFLDEQFNADNVSFQWTDPTGATISGNQPTAIAEVEGEYLVTLTPLNFEETCEFVTVVPVDNPQCLFPRGISPNGDTMNDNFDLTGFNVTKLSIFNRYGREVYSKTDYTNEWHGQTDGGDELPTGTYYFSLERANGDNKTGWVYINRQEN